MCDMIIGVKNGTNEILMYSMAEKREAELIKLEIPLLSSQPLAFRVYVTALVMSSLFCYKMPLVDNVCLLLALMVLAHMYKLCLLY